MASESGRSPPDRVASGTLEYRLKNVTINTNLHHPGVHHTDNDMLHLRQTVEHLNTVAQTHAQTKDVI